MSSQLEQLFGYLERDGVTQVIIGTGRPISMRTPTGFTNITARPLSADQLANFLRHPEIAPLVPDDDGEGEIADIQIGRRRALAQVRKRGHELLLSLSRSETPATPVATQPLARVAAPRTAEPPPGPAVTFTTPAPARPAVTFATPAPRAKSPTNAPRAKSPTNAPRAKSPTNAPRAKSPTNAPRAKSPTNAPRAKSPTNAPRAKSPSLRLRATPPAAVPLPSPSTGFDSFSLDDGGIELGGLGSSAPLELDMSPPAAHPAVLSLELDDIGSGPVPGEAGSGGISLELDPVDAPVDANRPATSPVAFAPTVRVPASPVAAPATTSQAIGRLSPQNLVRAESGAFGALVRTARERGASDLHVSAARVTSIRLINDLVPLDPNAPPLTAAEVADLLLPLLDDSMRAQLGEVGYVDLALEAPGGGRLRANICRQQQGLKGTFRLALAAPATLEQLGLPAELAKVVHHHQGLVIVAGPSGQGKTTTLAALVDMLNSSRAYHILTIEDPVEIVHPRKQAVISQRETGRHTTSFARGLKASLREDPDVIVIGELRDRESVEIALTAAETGHLVIATMSTPSAAKTIDRLIDMFPPEEHNQVRASIAGALRAIVAQRLLPKRGGGVIPAIELVTGVLPLAVMIREDKLYQLPNLLQRGRAFGMIRFDESLAEHVRAGRVDEEAALAVAESRKDLALALHPAAPAAPAKTTPIWGFGKKEQR